MSHLTCNVILCLVNADFALLERLSVRMNFIRNLKHLSYSTSVI